MAEASVRLADPTAIAEAAGLLREGRLVAFPTETVYGLGADATNDRAVASIYAAKGRPSFNPLIVHFADPGAAATQALFDPRADELATAFWPGPLTLVLPQAVGCTVSKLATAGLATIAVRVPAHPVALKLLALSGCPVAAPSANRSGRLSPTSPMHVAEQFGGEVAMVLAAGRSGVGLESTVVDLSGPEAVLLRPGGTVREDIEAVIGPVKLADPGEEAPKSPGMTLRHYAPSTPLRLRAFLAGAEEAYLGFGPDSFGGRGARTSLNLSETGDLTEAAANLFAMLHELDRPQHAAIAVAPIPEIGLGLAINDRLNRAATA